MSDIDWGFISRFEGGAILSGYVPDPDLSKSGVTIATGFDLGQWSPDDFKRLNLSASLTAKLLPYVGLKQDAAVKYLSANPLTITQAEAADLDRVAQERVVNTVKQKYDKAVAESPKGQKNWDGICGAARTVITSVAYQYGPALDVAAPKFWGDAVAQNWSAAEQELRNFDDNYPTRRWKEADYLAKGTCQ
jgi:hypothetical protein